MADVTTNQGAAGATSAGTDTGGSDAGGQAAGAGTQGGQATQAQQPTINVAELLDMRSKYESGMGELTSREKALKAEADKLAPYRDLASRLEQAKEHPDILVELLEQQTGKSFQELTKAIASRAPTSPEAVAALAGQKELKSHLAKLQDQIEHRAVLDELRPVLSDAKHSKLLEADGVTQDQIAQGIRALRAQGQNHTPKDLIEKHSAYVRSKAMSMLDADPSIAEEWSKRRDEAAKAAAAKADAAKVDPAKAAPGKAANVVPQGAQTAAKVGGTLTQAERRDRALAVLRGTK